MPLLWSSVFLPLLKELKGENGILFPQTALCRPTFVKPETSSFLADLVLCESRCGHQGWATRGTESQKAPASWGDGRTSH